MSYFDRTMTDNHGDTINTTNASMFGEVMVEFKNTERGTDEVMFLSPEKVREFIAHLQQVTSMVEIALRDMG